MKTGRVFLTVAVFVASLVGASWVWAQVDGQIIACVNESDGNIRIVSDPSMCKRHEYALTWNITGPEGGPGIGRPAVPAPNAISILANTADLFSYPSLAVGADGLPVIAYLGQDGLRVVHCDDRACTQVTHSMIVADSTQIPSGAITIGADGLPIIAYDLGFDGVFAAHCSDAACTSASINLVSSDAYAGFPSIAIMADGLPSISYQDPGTDHSLKVAHCADQQCTSASLAVVDEPAASGYFNDLTLGADGLPIISYVKHRQLKAAHCSDTQCSSATITVLDDRGWDTSITIGIDGLPIISYGYGETRDDLRVAHCNDAACTSATISILDSTGRVGGDTSIAISPSGMPVISYSDLTNMDLKLAYCRDIACTQAALTRVDSAGDVGGYSQLAFGADGLPLIAYVDHLNNLLKTARCSNEFCTPYFVR